MKNLILLGPPGVGKGTQAKMMVDKYKIPQISTGDILRTKKNENSAMGQEIKRIMETGGLVSDEIVIAIVKERIALEDCRDGFILDGFPRTVGQADALDQALEEMKKKINVAISIEADDAEVVKRLGGRRTCKKCGAMFHIQLNKPKKDGICDKCGSELYQRDDDNEDTIRNRLKVYHSQTLPLIEYYKRKGLLRTVPGTGSIDEIFNAIVKVVEGR